MLWNKLSVVILLQLILSYSLGRVLIPILRKFRTGKYDPYIGDRFSADGSEPAFGGAVMCIVFVFGTALSAFFAGEYVRLFLSAAYTSVITASASADDYMTDVLHKPYGVKLTAKIGFFYAAGFSYIMLQKQLGFLNTAVLLPFHLGTIDFGSAYPFIAAAFMTLVIFSFTNLNRFGTDDESCCGGLCQTVTFFIFSSCSIIGNIIADDTLCVFSCSVSASALGSLIWGLSPSKLRSGASGGAFCGAAAAALCGLSSYLSPAVGLCIIAAAADLLSSAVQYLNFKKNKKLLLKGSSLHMHLKAKGFDDYRIILVFSAATIAGCAAAVAFAAYSTNILM